MRKSVVISTFETSRQHGVVRLAKLLKISRQAIYQWNEEAIPERQARRIARLSKLRVDERLYADLRKKLVEARRIAGGKRKKRP
jgi:hypothetical protein